MSRMGHSADDSSLLRLALGVKRKSDGVGPRSTLGAGSAGFSSVAHLGPLLLALGGEAGTGVGSGRIKISSTPSSSSSSLRVRSMIWRFRLTTGSAGLCVATGLGMWVISGEALSRL
jgi:hypothetical protein